MARLAGWAALLVGCALPAVGWAQTDAVFEGAGEVNAPLFNGPEPASQWIGQARPGDVLPEGESVHQGLFATPGRPRLLERLLCCGGCAPGVQRESWLRRPLSITWSTGGVVGSPLIDDWVRAEGGLFGGLHLGWDFDHYWGAELRLSFGTMSLIDSQRAIDARHAQDQYLGYASGDAYRHRFDYGRNADLMMYSLTALYYPRGDAAWRPYVLIGVGGTRISFNDRLGEAFDETLLTMPLGIGVKYHWTDWLALRFEVCNNMAFGAGRIETLHNVSIIGAAEIRLGGSRRSYWPWVPGRKSW